MKFYFGSQEAITKFEEKSGKKFAQTFKINDMDRKCIERMQINPDYAYVCMYDKECEGPCSHDCE